MENLNLEKNDIGVIKTFEVRVGFFGKILSHDKKFYEKVKGEFKIINVVDYPGDFIEYKVTLKDTIYDIEKIIKLMAIGYDLEVKFR